MNEDALELVTHILKNLPKDDSELVKILRDNPVKFQECLVEFYLSSNTSNSIVVHTVRNRTTKTSKESFVYFESPLIMRSFKRRILSGVESRVKVASSVKVKYFDVTDVTNGMDVRKSLPKDYLFKDMKLFLSNLALLISVQRRGGRGVLSTDICGNIFFVENTVGESFIVSVCWSGRAGSWSCNAYVISRKLHFSSGRIFLA